MKDKQKIREEISKIDGQIESGNKDIRALENEIEHLRERKQETEALLREPEESDNTRPGNGD